MVNPEHYSIKILNDDITVNNAASLIKEHFFDGSIEVLCFGINDNEVLKKMIVDTIIINPKIIMCSPSNRTFLNHRYDLVDSKVGVFIRKDLQVSNEVTIPN